MMKLLDYQVTDQLVTTSEWELWRALSKGDQKPVLIKLLRANATSQQKSAFIHEFYTIKDQQIYGLLKPITLEQENAQPFIVMENFYSESFSDWLDSSSPMFELSHFLKQTIQLTTILFSVHQHHIIHQRVHPDHILIDPKSQQFRLTGFHQSTKLSREMLPVTDHTYQINDLAFLSPEQTGKMNRSVDYRTDLYSLGILFYLMTTGKLPFNSQDPSDVIHSHLAQTAVPPHRINTNIPEMISLIIMKLLEKMPEHRYQSTSGLKKDLEKCLRTYQSSDRIDSFPLAESDAQPLLEKSLELYGREQELSQLLAMFEGLKHGVPSLLLVPGPSGVGKTALVQHLHKPLLHRKGYFVSGKFVQYQQHIPYAPVLDAFRSLIRQVLTEDSSRVQLWKEKLEDALSHNAWLIANFIPEIAWLIGSQQEGIDLPPQAIHHRFLLAVRKFVEVFASSDHPLVLFIDDLQWADNATLDLIDHLLTNPDERNLLIIGAYRDNEIVIGQPFELFLKQLHGKEISMSTIPVAPLTKQNVEEWLMDVFSFDINKAQSLAEVTYRITKGNPFFINQWLQLLNQDQVLQFDISTATWHINLHLLQQISVTDSMIDLMLNQLNRLPTETVKLLQLASCIGSTFNLQLVSKVSQQSFRESATRVWEAMEEGLILPLENRYKWFYPDSDRQLLEGESPSYRFLHDKIRQAFYTSMTEIERERHHIAIAKVLIDQFSDQEWEEAIFSIVNHLNSALDQLDDRQRIDLIKWNRLAGSKARQTAAFESALMFYQQSYQLLPEQSWRHLYEETFRVMFGYGEALYLNRKFSEAETIFEEMLYQAKTKREQLSIYNLKIMLYNHIHEVEKAVDSGLTGTELFGLKVKERPGNAMIALEYLKTKLALRKKKKIDLLHLPVVLNKDEKLIMRTMINTNASAYHVNQNLATVLMLRALRLILKFGDMDVAALVYNNYALTLGAGFGDYKASYQFGQLALQHVKKSGDRALQARVYFVYGTFINHWKHHMRLSLDYLERSQQLCIETGNLHLAGSNSAFIGLTHVIKGDRLDEVKAGIDRQLIFANKNEYALSDDLLKEILDWIEILSDEKIQPTWNLPGFTDDLSTTIIHKTLRLQMAYLFEEDAVAKTLIEELEALVKGNRLILVIIPEFYFYHSLWLIRFMQSNKKTRKDNRRKVKANLKRLKKWAVYAPDNYMHKYLLVKAEMKQLSGNDQGAVADYHQAISLAESNRFLQDAAIASHRAAEFYLSRKIDRTAKSYATEAYNGYLYWGASHLAERFRYQYSHLLLQVKQDQTESLHVGLAEKLDTEALFEAARLLSSEVVFDQLITKLMDVFIKYAGAEHASFLLQYEKDLGLVGFHHMELGVEVYQRARPIEYHLCLSSAVVHYVATSREAVVLDHATNIGAFTEDAYIKREQVKSVLCLPLMHQDKLVAVLYMENNKSTHIFTHERLNKLSFIASQAAVAIENAYLYRELEEKVKNRTQLLNASNHQLTIVNQQLSQQKEKIQHLLSNVSHDLQSPIAVVKGYISTLRDGLVQDPNKQNEYLHIMHDKIDGLNKLIKDLFDLSKLESGNLRFSMDIIPVRQLYNHLAKHLKSDVEQAHLHFKGWYDEKLIDASPLIEVDPRRIEQVMMNLVSNAIKHTASGSIEIGIVKEETETVTFFVRDTGKGISQSDIPYLFDRYFTKNDKEGNGLGLAICKEIVEYHQGELWVESKELIGTTFYFSLPVVFSSLSVTEG
ncbi:AAA family ATPase [Gracilibacillus caseinilyticus]|uniref:histidine kinase n=1 Tax=Gracilibacillus caseinilyticus TaxID=2932256 RepID=A0ABY4F049_9BACI|nr:AAA family ATPase [Gracilibacillus caseinilyticus]UOQ49890.1 AAA family ATPase [Gracilibacillus caseinilyticus]